MGMGNERKIKDEKKIKQGLDYCEKITYEKKGRIKWADYKSDKIR